MAQHRAARLQQRKEAMQRHGLDRSCDGTAKQFAASAMRGRTGHGGATARQGESNQGNSEAGQSASQQSNGVALTSVVWAPQGYARSPIALAERGPVKALHGEATAQLRTATQRHCTATRSKGTARHSGARATHSIGSGLRCVGYAPQVQSQPKRSGEWQCKATAKHSTVKQSNGMVLNTSVRPSQGTAHHNLVMHRQSPVRPCGGLAEYRASVREQRKQSKGKALRCTAMAKRLASTLGQSLTIHWHGPEAYSPGTAEQSYGRAMNSKSLPWQSNEERGEARARSGSVCEV